MTDIAAHHTDEKMIPLFEKDTDGSKLSRKVGGGQSCSPIDADVQLVQPRRNYAAVDYLDNGELRFDFRVEKAQGAGETVSYPIVSPPPRWSAPA